MSALTDLFTAMANKIRTKTGTQTTYTPSEIVSDGIDDVYDAGVESATTPITPSNASPASMTSGTGYKPTANGYAIESYNNVTPSDSSPVPLTSGDIDKMGGNGYAISGYDIINVSSIPKTLYKGYFYKVTGEQQYAVKSINLLSPSNANPPAISRYGAYYADWAGYAIESYTSVTPSSTPESVASGDIVKIGGSGVIVDSIPTPTSITPSDSSPAALTANTPVTPSANGYAIESNPTGITPTNISTPPSITASTIYKAIDNGYAIKDYANCTPSDSSPNTLYNGQIYRVQDPNKSTGAKMGYAIESYDPVTPTANGAAFNAGIIKMSSSGYAYSQMPSVEDYDDILSPSEYTSYTLTDLEVGKKYLVLLWNWGSSASYSNIRFDEATASGGTLTKISNLRELSGTARVAGTFFLLEPSATSVTITCSNLFQTHLITAVGGVIPGPQPIITLDKLLYDSSKTLLGSITTYSDSYTASKDCVMFGYAKGGSNNYSPMIYFNGEIALFSNASSGTRYAIYIGYANTSDTDPSTYGVFIPKGTTVSCGNRSDQTYNLKFYSL